MLPPVHRLRESALFRQATRKGRKSGSRTLVVHLWEEAVTDGPRIGLVVSKAVGNAVTRNSVKRRLRHQAREQLPLLPGSAVLVVRALPAAAEASSEQLSADLSRCVARVLS